MGQLGMPEELRAQIWRRWKQGESLSEIGRALGRPPSTIFSHLRRQGGVAPRPRVRDIRSLHLHEREEISRGLLAVPIPLVAVRTSVFADTVEPYSSTMAPPTASRVTVPGAEMLSKTTPVVLLVSLLRSMSPFQVTSMSPADVEALRVNVLPVAVPLVT